MAFNTNKGRQSFTASGGQTDFDFNFKIYEVTDIKVYLTPTGSTPDDTTDLLTYGSDYTVSIDGDDGGTVTLISGATLNDIVVCERELPRTRDVSYVTNGDLKAATLNEDQDYQTYLLVDDFNTADRSLSLPSTDVTMTPELPATLPDGYLKVKDDGTGYEYSLFTGATFEDLVTVDTVANLDDIDTNLFTVAVVKDLIRGGLFIYDSTYASINNDGTIFNGWVRQYEGAIKTEWFGDLTNNLFGRGNIRTIAGKQHDAHYGWGSIVEIPNSNKWVMNYRKGSEHGTDDGSELRAAVSYDFGVSWENDTLIYTNPLSDSRPDRLDILANGRIGCFVNRADEGTTHFSPLFVYSDDEGATWSYNVVTTSSPYTFSAVGGIISYPTSQGGNDTTGFISFGYLSAGGLDAFTTVDNGDTWSIVTEVAQAITGDSSISENVQVRLGTEDKWLMFARSRGESTDDVIVYKTTNLLDWGNPTTAGIASNATPPAGYYKDGKVYYIRTARSGREYNNLANHILEVSEDANTLWDNNGVFTNAYRVVAAVPNWFTGYIYPFESVLGVCAAFTAGEPVSNTNPSFSGVHVIGNFEASMQDMSVFTDWMMKRQKAVKSIEIVSDDNETNTYAFQLYNQAKSASILQSPYIFSRNGGGSSYLMAYNDGDVSHTYGKNVSFSSEEDMTFEVASSGNIKLLDYNVMFGGLTAQINSEAAALHIPVGGSTVPAIRSQAIGTSSARKHYVFHHTNLTTNPPEVGSISTTTTATAYNTSSDETLKDFIGEYSSDEAIAIIKQDPVKKFTWKTNGEAAIGWGAQTSYKVSKDLASPGGWFKDDKEVKEGTPGAVYIPWGVDHSKRTPYLWAALAKLIDRVEILEDEIKTLKGV
jgi:hypothetical protein